MTSKFTPPHEIKPDRALLLAFGWIVVGAFALGSAHPALIVGVTALVSALSAVALWPRSSKVPAELRCAFCYKGREEVYKLVAGPDDTYICDECVRISSDIVSYEELPNETERILRVLEAAMWKPLPQAEGERLLDAWLVLAPDPESCRRAARNARSGGNLALARRALEAVPEDARSAAHRLDSLELEIVDFEDPRAAAQLETVDGASLEPDERVELDVLQAFVRFEEASPSERSDLAQRARRALESLGGTPSWAAGPAEVITIALEMRVAHARGDLALAERIGAAATAAHTRSALLWELLSEVRIAAGNDGGAREAQEQARLCCGPESPRARRLHSRGVGPFR